jgi:DNA-binding HxlR family transcriptional regulator
MLILHEAMRGFTRFDEFRQSLGIAPSVLTRRLNGLVESGLLLRRRYSVKPPRDEYILTDCGRDFLPAMLAILAWGNRHFAPEGRAVLAVCKNTGKRVDPIVVDRKTGEVFSLDKVSFSTRPAT